MRASLLSPGDALDRVLAVTSRQEGVVLPLAQTLGLVVAEVVGASRDVPAFEQPPTPPEVVSQTAHGYPRNEPGSSALFAGSEVTVTMIGAAEWTR